MDYIIKRTDLSEFAKKFAEHLKDGDVICVNGDLGAGKTTFVQEIAKIWGVDGVTSPTFALVESYSGAFDFYHMDFYRLEDASEIETLDYESFFYPDGISFIEWGERVESYLPEGLIQIDIQIVDLETRRFTIQPSSDRALEILEAMS